MNKNIIIVILVVVILAVVGYFIFVKQSSAPASIPTATSVPATSQPEQTGPVVYTDAPGFAPSFSQCSPSEFKTPFPGDNIYVITVFGLENSKCHYAVKVVDKNGVVVQGGPPEIDCNVPEELISNDVLLHLFGADTEKTLAEQTKIETDYCIKK